VPQDDFSGFKPADDFSGFTPVRPTPRAAAAAAAPAPRPAAPAVDPGYPETRPLQPGLIATTPGPARSGPGSYRGTSGDPVPIDALDMDQIMALLPGIYVRMPADEAFPEGEVLQFGRVNMNASDAPERVVRGAQRQYGVLAADDSEGPRSPGERFTSTFDDVMNMGAPAAIGRWIVGGDKGGYRTDPTTGERYYLGGVGTQTRNAERLRRYNYALTTQGDEWYRQEDWVNRMVAVAATLVGGVGGALTDPTNFAGGGGKNMLLRAGGNFGFGAVQDAALQGLDVRTGVQDEYDPMRTALAGTLNAAIPLGTEAILNRFAARGAPEPYGPPARGAPAGRRARRRPWAPRRCPT